MKRLILGIGIFSLLSIAVFAQDFTLEGIIDIENLKSEDELTSSERTIFSLSLAAGYYITENLNAGLRFSYWKQDIKDSDVDSNSITIAPRLCFDFLHFENVYFSVLGELAYTKFNSAYTFRGFGVDEANRISVSVSPRINLIVNQYVAVYWQFGTIAYRYDWMEILEKDASENQFRISGPLRDPSFGLIFRF